jgi:hypothetical protein
MVAAALRRLAPAYTVLGMACRRGDDAAVAYPLFQEGDGGSTPTSPLSFRIEEIGMRLAQDLNRQWHSMLPRTDLGNLLCGNMSVAYGAWHEGVWYAVGIWSQPIILAMCDGHTIELRRLAICDAAPKNTASRMLRVMRLLVVRKFPRIRRLVSYLAVDEHRGTIYRASGWQPVGKIVDARPQRFSNVNRKTRATAPLQTHSRKQRWERLI